MPPGPSRTGRKGYGSMAKLAFMAARISDSLADMRQENVLFIDAVAQGGMLFVKSIQEGVLRPALKLERVNGVPDWRICRKGHYEMRHLADL
jgi:hypothetical protein